MKRLVLTYILSLITITSLNAQQVKGYVFEILEENKSPLVGANVYQPNSANGTITDQNGFFSFDLDRAYDTRVVVSFVGYLNDTLAVNDLEGEQLNVILREKESLSEVEIVSRQKGGYISRISTQSIESITGEGLRQAACCNLSESFENSATVSVSFSDAITGAKQIEMLGLAGRYTQIMQENIPNLRGLAAPFGLGYYPGDWLESIQVSKGSSSVINGYESITGQINLELKKPDKSEKFFLNLYGNSFGRVEGNLNGRIRINDHWSTMLLLHASNNSMKHDRNDDSFLDMPLVTQVNVYNRWNYSTDNVHLGFGAKYLTEDRRGGQVFFNPNEERTEENGYGIGVETERFEGDLKLGYIMKNRDFTSIGFQNQFVMHQQRSFFGLTDYDADELSYYGNLIFQSYMVTVSHKFTTGISYLYDRYEEVLNDSVFNRTESVPGAFFQYTYSDGKKLNIIAGLRADLHNIFGLLVTPRLNVRYSLDERNIFRASAGKGYHSANVIAENTGLLATSRKIVVGERLDIESAWNFGISYNHFLPLEYRELVFGLDVFYTNFQNQAIVNRDSYPQFIYISNLDGRSYSTSIQAEVRWEAFTNFDVLLAFRYNDVRTTLNQTLMEKDMVNRYKGLLSLSYATNLNKWQFDLNTQLNGDSRLPNTTFYPEEFQQPARSPVYLIMNAQVTKIFKRWEIYVGGENLTNYRQENPIISPNNPFGEYFDATMVWGPIMGIKVYAGIRVTLK